MNYDTEQEVIKWERDRVLENGDCLELKASGDAW